jgi:cytochrome c peroxidase
MFRQRELVFRPAIVLIAVAILCAEGVTEDDPTGSHAAVSSGEDREQLLDRQLRRMLQEVEFTGRVESTLERRLGRPLDPNLSNLGRLLWFDVSGGLHDDNTCGGCHSPTNGMGDTQPIAIGIQNNNHVGEHRGGPRNQRRTPAAANSAFYPKLMWNGRFSATSGDPFDNSRGFSFPPPEGTMKFLPNDPIITHLLIAQAHMPPTELVEVAGFTGTAGTIGPRFDAFDDGKGGVVPPPDSSGFRNEPIRRAVLDRLNSNPKFRALFGQVYPSVAAGGAIDFTHFARAITEFEFMLTFADAPLDRFARGDRHAMTRREKKGAVLFFGKAGCVACHSVSGKSNEMFSDFQMHVAGVPQVAPFFGVAKGNVIFDGPNEDEDFGLEQITGNPEDRYEFRTSPLRNALLQAAFFHDGAFTRLDDAIRYHLNAPASARSYDPIAAGLPDDLTYRLGPVESMLAKIDPRLKDPVILSEDEFRSLVDFVGHGLLDVRAKKQSLCRLVPASVPSGLHTMQFEGCPPQK